MNNDIIYSFYFFQFLASITQQGIAKLAEKEEELQFLKMEVTHTHTHTCTYTLISLFLLFLFQLAKLQREIKIGQGQLPEKEELERDLTLHQNMVIK